MHFVDLDFSHIVCFLVCQNFRFVWVDFEPLRFCICLKAAINFLSCVKEVAIMSMSSAKRRLDMQSLFSSLSLMPKPALRCSASDPELIALHVSQYGGALVSVQFFKRQLFFFADRMVSGRLEPSFCEMTVRQY